MPSETPPRAWGRLRSWTDAHKMSGNTPTGVGKTPPPENMQIRSWKHPHGRGEDNVGKVFVPVFLETPPRAWGRRHAVDFVRVLTGNTPTGVGKTAIRPTFGVPF